MAGLSPSFGGTFEGRMLLRPYTGTCKRAAVRVYTRLEPPFFDKDSAYLYDSSPKRGI